ncbi:serine protease inhibitor I/II-like isoform X1 [Cotesia glomerata]|uniref:serine protease inhibitor I/II-like isoform X1 n=1 Tax=Cotesia glomerata TaxID=32391 RepID=UPI001D02AF78|nr:serine protease inhibitor I/II-like isoform X1 [Cotesia glomerata]
MKMMISFALMVLVAIVAATERMYMMDSDGTEYIVIDKEPKHCEPGMKYLVDCNKCSCSSNGKDLACTRRKCPPHPVQQNFPWGPFWKHGDPCPANKEFYSECNRCQCGPDGKSAVCTLKACIRPVV